MCVIVTSQADTMPSLTQLARMSDANPCLLYTSDAADE